MSDINVSIFSGRLTKNPESRKTPSGVTVTDLTVASNRYGRKPEGGGERPQFTTYARVTVWNRQAEVLAEMLHTGDNVLAKGQLFDDNFEQEKDDGSKFMTSGRLKIDNAEVTILNRRQTEGSSETAETPDSPSVPSV